LISAILPRSAEQVYARWVQAVSRIRPPTSYCKIFLVSILRKGMRAARVWRAPASLGGFGSYYSINGGNPCCWSRFQ